jgi:hypothetical protein
MVDADAKSRVKEAKDEAIKVASEAKALAELASQSKNDWGVRWQTVVAMVTFIGILIAAMVGMAKLSEPPARANGIHSAPSSPSRP